MNEGKREGRGHRKEGRAVGNFVGRPFFQSLGGRSGVKKTEDGKGGKKWWRETEEREAKVRQGGKEQTGEGKRGNGEKREKDENE